MKRKTKWTIAIVAVAAAMLACTALYFRFFSKLKPDTQLLVATLEKSDELTSAKLNYEGMYHYDDSGVPIWNKSNFYMVYKATARAGVNLKDVKITSDDKKKIVTITMPEAKVQEVKIDTDDIQFYDVGFSLFNWDARDDENRAIAKAEADAESKITDLGILEFADNTAKEVVTGLLTNALPEGYTLEFITTE